MELDDDAFVHCVRVNVLGSLHLVRAVYPHMRARRDGRIVNISSISSKNRGTLVRSDPGARRWGVAYAATKGATDSITQWIAREVRPDRIRCNAVRWPTSRSRAWGAETTSPTRSSTSVQLRALASDMAGFVTRAGV